jgi:hypothetical protein
LDLKNFTFGVKKSTFGVENPSFCGLFLLQAVIHFHKIGKKSVFLQDVSARRVSVGKKKSFFLLIAVKYTTFEMVVDLSNDQTR